MQRRVFILLGAALLVGVTVAAEAQYEIPRKAPLLNTFFVNAYEPCTAPNDSIFTTHIGSEDACNPPVRSDPTCGFGDKGMGRLLLKDYPPGAHGKTLGGMLGKLMLRGLEGCEGERLELKIRVRTTTACEGADAAQNCTSTVRELNPAACVIQDGKCSASPGAGFAVDAVFTFLGANTEIVDVFLERGGVRTLSSGILMTPGRL